MAFCDVPSPLGWRDGSQTCRKRGELAKYRSLGREFVLKCGSSGGFMRFIFFRSGRIRDWRYLEDKHEPSPTLCFQTTNPVNTFAT